MLKRIIKLFLVGAAIYPLLAIALLAWPVPAPRADRETSQYQRPVRTPVHTEPAPALIFRARDGAERLYRIYSGTDARPDGDLLLMLHGSGSDTRYLAGLANMVATGAAVRVVTLDMRGHGPTPVRRGDVDYVDQQEHDIADLLSHFRSQGPYTRFLLGGHSLGGGLAIRYAAGRQQPKPDGLVLLAPYVHRNSPAARPDAGGWATPFITRFAGIEMLQRVGLRRFDHLPVLRFELPPEADNGSKTPVYSWRLFASATPRDDWKGEIARIDAPLLVLAGANDSVFRPEGYAAIFGGSSGARTETLPNLDHLEIAMSDVVANRIVAWLLTGL